ncbi:MAG: TetR/AcrR family transcriptional regulator [Aquihabitans sp.]
MSAATAAEAPSTRERILAAALAAFAERGVEATSLDSVAVEVGVRKQTLLYWFPSKEQLLFGVVDHAVDELGRVLSEAALAGGADLTAQITAVVDATFRLGSLRPELLAVVREVARLGPPASTHLARASEPLVATASSVLVRSGGGDDARTRAVLLAAGARVVGIATEAEVRDDLGLPADLAWLRERRRSLISSLSSSLAGP